MEKEDFNVTYCQSVIKIFEALLRYFEARAVEGLPELRIAVYKTIEEWNLKMKDYQFKE